MDETIICINEWNATIEALGQGKQTILIRKYDTTLNEFLLYPTITYTKKNGVLNSFNKKYQNFAKDNLFPVGENRTYEVKYYATVEKIIEKSSSRIGAFNKFHIWTRDHVKDYLDDKKAKIWILRVYKLDEPQMLKRSNGLKYAKVNKPVELKGKPVLSDVEFEKLKNNIINTRG